MDCSGVYEKEASAAVQVNVPLSSRGSARPPAEFTPAERPQALSPYPLKCRGFSTE
jgi:hypothetical protein